MTENNELEQRIQRLEQGFESLVNNIVDTNAMLIQLKQKLHEIRSLQVPDSDNGGYI